MIPGSGGLDIAQVCPRTDLVCSQVSSNTRGSMHRAYFLIVTAVFEAGVGLIMLVVPAVPLARFLQVDQPTVPMLFLARIAGAALVGIAVACWFACSDTSGGASRGLLLGVLVYDVAAAGILAITGLEDASLSNPMLWGAVGAHVVLALWCVACLREAFRLV